MADIANKTYYSLVRTEGSAPTLLPSVEDPQNPVNPPGSGGLTGVNQFIQLTDTPASYSGATLNYARVNAGGTGLEFRTPAQVKSDLGVVESINAGAGIQVNPNPTASTPQVALTGQALSFHSLTGDGFVYRTSGTVGVRTLTAGTGITITNGDGIGGNPVISATGSIIVQRGTFTPTLSASGLSFTYTTQTGFYTQIDDLVFVYIEIIFTSSGTPSGGNLRVSNLPKQGLASEAQHLPVEKMQNSGYSSADVSRLTFRIDGNLTRGDVVFKNSSIAPLTTYGSVCLLVIQGVYKTSSP